MTELMTSIGSIFTQMLTWLGNVITFVTGNDLLFFVVICSIVTSIIGFGVRFLKRNV